MISSFPADYKKPVLCGIVTATESGWSVKCASGGVPSSGWNDCANGPNVGQGQPCPGHGQGDSANRLFNNHGSSGVLNPDNVGSGL